MYLEIFPKNIKKHTHTMFLLHGYSCTAKSMKYYAYNINKRLPPNIRIKYICPQAPTRYIFCYSEKEPAWYNYYTDFCYKEEEINYTDVNNMTNELKKYIDIEAEKLDGDYKKIFIAGNSQGACQAIHLGLSIKQNIGGILSFRGHMLSKTPLDNKQFIWASHGEQDDAIGYEVAKKSYDVLDKKGYTIHFHKDKYMDHYEHNEKEFDSCCNWLKLRF